MPETHVADNILSRLWDAYRKEHPKAERPPQSLKDEAEEIRSKQKKSPKKESPEEKRERVVQEDVESAGFKGLQDIAGAHDDLMKKHDALSSEEKASPAGKHLHKRLQALEPAMEAVQRYERELRGQGGEDNDTSEKYLQKYQADLSSALEKYTDLGEAPTKGVSDEIKKLVSKGERMFNKLKKSLSGKRSSALKRRTIRLAYLRPDLRPVLLPILRKED